MRAPGPEEAQSPGRQPGGFQGAQSPHTLAVGSPAEAPRAAVPGALCGQHVCAKMRDVPGGPSHQRLPCGLGPGSRALSPPILSQDPEWHRGNTCVRSTTGRTPGSCARPPRGPGGRCCGGKPEGLGRTRGRGMCRRVSRWLGLVIENRGSTGWPVLWWMLAWALSQLLGIFSVFLLFELATRARGVK